MVEFHPESKIQESVIKYARSQGFLCRKYVNEGRRSAPDYILFKDGRVLFIEFKATGKSATVAQKREHRKLERVGHYVFVCDDITKGKTFIDEAMFWNFSTLILRNYVKENNA